MLIGDARIVMLEFIGHTLWWLRHTGHHHGLEDVLQEPEHTHDSRGATMHFTESDGELVDESESVVDDPRGVLVGFTTPQA